MIPYAMGFPKDYTITIKGNNVPITLNRARSFYNVFNNPSIPVCENNLCFKVLENNKNAVLTISSFNYYYWDKYEVFKDFMDSTFLEIEKQGIEKLIIDLRF